MIDNSYHLFIQVHVKWYIFQIEFIWIKNQFSIHVNHINSHGFSTFLKIHKIFRTEFEFETKSNTFDFRLLEESRELVIHDKEEQVNDSFLLKISSDSSNTSKKRRQDDEEEDEDDDEYEDFVQNDTSDENYSDIEGNKIKLIKKVFVSLIYIFEIAEII